MCRRIKIIRTNTIEINYKKPELIIMRLTKSDGTPANSVFLLGNVEKVKRKLFCISQPFYIQSDLGKKYGAEPTRHPHRIDVTNPNIKGICKDLKIRKVVIVRFNTF
jgi:hypothetical protein